MYIYAIILFVNISFKNMQTLNINAIVLIQNTNRQYSLYRSFIS